jgi:predicted dienelactone hydrolase
VSLLQLTAVVAFGQEVVTIQRQDQKAMAIAAYSPKTGNCRGIAIISPGAGGSEKGYQYLGEGMASLGYLAVVMGHQESGPRAVRERLRGRDVRAALADLITDPNAYRGRFLDIATSTQWAHGRCQGTEAVLVGHSMGAATAMLEAGARNHLDMSGSDSFGMYVALSPQGAGSIFPANAWSDIKRPVLSLTGTRDDELQGASWETRTEPYRNMPVGCKWLGVIDGATHMNLAGLGMARGSEELITKVIGAFVDGVRRGDCAAPRQVGGIDLRSK